MKEQSSPPDTVDENTVVPVVVETAKPGKDIWDKLAAVAPIFSGVLMFVVGGYFTFTYNQEQLRLQQIQTIEKFIPLLAGDEHNKRAAILAISSLTNTELAGKMASIYASTGTASALQTLAENGTAHDKVVASNALATTLEKLASREGKLGEIESALKDEVQQNGAKQSASPGEVAKSLSQLAELYMLQGQYTLAEPLFERALSLNRQAFGDRDPRVNASCSALAQLYRLKGEPDKAAFCLKQAQELAGIPDSGPPQSDKQAEAQPSQAKPEDSHSLDKKAQETAQSESKPETKQSAKSETEKPSEVANPQPAQAAEGSEKKLESAIASPESTL
jgi:tetratricopeptide (TPR) repeat protein